MTEPDQSTPESHPGLNPTSGGGGTQRLATYLPHELHVDDLVITPEGTDVPDDQADHVFAVAAENGVPVYEMES